MAKVFVYNEAKQITDEINSEDYTLDQLLQLLVIRTPKQGEVTLKIEECFSSGTYFNVHFVPDALRVDPKLNS